MLCVCVHCSDKGFTSCDVHFTTLCPLFMKIKFLDTFVFSKVYMYPIVKA